MRQNSNIFPSIEHRKYKEKSVECEAMRGVQKMDDAVWRVRKTEEDREENKGYDEVQRRKAKHSRSTACWTQLEEAHLTLVSDVMSSSGKQQPFFIILSPSACPPHSFTAFKV